MLYNIFSLIVGTIASVLGGVFLMRFWMQAIRVRPPASVAQFVFQLSDWLVKPLRRVLPGMGGYDWASLVGALLVAMIWTAIDVSLVFGFSFVTVALLSISCLFKWLFYGLMGLILIEIVFSWVNPHAPLAPFVRAMNTPLLRPLRRVFPLIGGIDLTPLIALILLQVGLQLLGKLAVLLT